MLSAAVSSPRLFPPVRLYPVLCCANSTFLLYFCSSATRSRSLLSEIGQSGESTNPIFLNLPSRSDTPTCVQANAASGIAVDDECKHRFLELKETRTHRFIFYEIDEGNKMVVVEKVGERVLNYDDFVAALPQDECRYAICDYDVVTESCQKSKIFFIACCNGEGLLILHA
nr:unnamed protein product [Digitaria exilis]